jgi:hypothetical protein
VITSHALSRERAFAVRMFKRDFFTGSQETLPASATSRPRPPAII